MLPNVLTSCIEAWVSSVRIQKYLLSPEIDPTSVEHTNRGGNDVVMITDGHFSWDTSAREMVLKNINFQVYPINSIFFKFFICFCKVVYQSVLICFLLLLFYV